MIKIRKSPTADNKDVRFRKRESRCFIPEQFGSYRGQFTAGPWEADHCTEHRVKDDPGHWQIDGPTPMGLNNTMPYTVADTLNRNYCISPEEDKANALLIAASPELYGALEAIAEAFLDNRLHEYSGNVMPLVWAALKKAGRQ
jgi:hypothetical protein